MNSKLKIILFFLISTPEFIFADAGIRLITDYAFANGRSGRNGHEVNAAALYKYYKKNQLELGYSMIGKSYSNIEMKYDRMLRLGHSWNFNESVYLYTHAEKNISQHYNADWSIYAEPHFLPHPNLDLAVGGQWKSYPIHKAFNLRGLVALTPIDRLTLMGRSDIALKPERAIAGEGSLEFQIHPRFALRAGGGGGKSDEGDGLLDDFYQYFGRASFDLTEELKINALTQIYRGDLRKENRYGGGLDLQF